MGEYIKNYDRDKFPDLYDKLIGSDSGGGVTYNYAIKDILSLQDGRYLVALFSYYFTTQPFGYESSGHMSANDIRFENVTTLNLNKTNANGQSVTEYMESLMYFITISQIEIQVYDSTQEANFGRYSIVSITEHEKYYSIVVSFITNSSNGFFRERKIFYVVDTAASITAGSGDMRKAVYDRNNDGVVDNAERVNGLTVQTAVPLNAKFTDTVYDDTLLSGRVGQNESDIAAIYLDKSDKDINVVIPQGDYITDISDRDSLITMEAGSLVVLDSSGLSIGFRQLVFNKTGADINLSSPDNVIGVNDTIPAGHFAMYYLIEAGTWAVSAPIGTGAGGGGDGTLVGLSDTPSDYGTVNQILISDGINMTHWGFVRAENVTYNNINSNLNSDEVQGAIDELKDMIDEIITPSAVRNFTFTGYSRYVDINHSFINPIFNWEIIGDPDDLILSDSEGKLPANLDVTGEESYASSATWTLGQGDSVTWQIGGSNIDSVSVSSSAFYRSYWGINTTGNLPTDTEIENGASFLQPTSSSVSAAVVTDAEYGWIAVEVIQTGSQYTKWYITDTNNGTIGTGDFIKYGGRVHNVGSFDKEYDVYIYNYPSTNNQTIRLNK